MDTRTLNNERLAVRVDADVERLAERIVQLGGLPEHKLEGLAARGLADYHAALAATIRANLAAECSALERHGRWIALVSDMDADTRQRLEDIVAVQEQQQRAR
jgi:bacterioferritin